MFVPYLAEVTMPRWPIVNWVLIGVTLLIFVLAEVGYSSPSDAGLRLSRDDFSVFQLLSYQFLHGGLLHLLGNMIFLWTFGNAVNARLGHVLFIVAYLVCGIISGLIWLMLGHGGTLIGASGAIMGMAGLFAVYYPRNNIRVFYFLLFRGGVFRLSAIWLILLYFGLDLFSAARGGGGQVAYIAHVGGALAGFLIGCLLLALGIVGSHQDEQNILEMLGIWKPRDRAMY